MDWNNDYTFAGKGARARERERLSLQSIPKKMKKARPYQKKPEYENRKVIRERMSEAYNSAKGVKTRIRLLVVDHDASFLDICEAMKQQGYSISGVTISNIRTEMREVMKLLEGEGLLNVDALARRRRKIKAHED